MAAVHTEKAGGNTREYYLDAARAFLMILGVPYHAALIYAPDYHWLIDSTAENAAMGLFAEFIHSFRMPAFFLISGILTTRSLRSGGPRAVLASRATRLLVPLAVVACTLNVLQLWIAALALDGSLSAGDFLGEVLPAAFWRGELTMHLWFLLELFVCVLLACAAYPALSALHTRLAAHDSGWLPPALLSVLLVGTMGLDNVSPLLTEKLYPASSSVATMAVSASYFAVGALIAGAPGGVRRFAATGWTVALAYGLCFLAHLVLAEVDKPMALRVIDQLLRAVCAWTAFRLLLGAALTCFAGESAGVHALSRASYTIYLLHHAVVVGAGFAFLAIPWRPGVEFAAIAVAGLGIPFLFHHAAVRKSRILTFLLNGVPPRTGTAMVRPARGREAVARRIS